MRPRLLVSFIGSAVLLLLVARGAAQVPSHTADPPSVKKTWSPPRTPDGRPDLQGIWSDNVHETVYHIAEAQTYIALSVMF